MALPDLNFDQIRPYDGSRHAGFEELTAQLASLEPRPAGAAFFRKGRGADGGVEAFLKLADGSETGWQAKYVLSWDGSLGGQLDTSISTALEKHPKLSTFIVCLPFDLSDSRKDQTKSALQKWNDWKKKWLDHTKANKRKLTIELWSKSTFATKLAAENPHYAGRLAYWFGVESFTPAWFDEQFAKTRASLGQRYTPESNIELPIRQDFLAFCRDPSLSIQVKKWIQFVLGKGPSCVQAIKDAVPATETETHSTLLATALGHLTDVLDSTIGPDKPFPLEAWIDAASEAERVAEEARYWAYTLKSDEPGEFGAGKRGWVREYLYRLGDGLSDMVSELKSDRWRLANAKAALLHGPAGIGKSHLLADIVEHQIHQGRPAVMVLGSALNDGEPWRQILQELDFPPTLQVKHFLGALDAAAEAAGTRAIVCVDALNERNGPDIWPSRLAAFLQTAEPFPRVVIAVSCRSTYLPYIVPDDIPSDALVRIEHEGFAGDEGQAAKAYLDLRGIVRPGAPSLLPEFENPLFLKTCCDFLEKEGKRELPKGLRGITSIFGFYNSAVAHALNRRMKLDRHQEIIPKAITGFAGLLADATESYLPKSATIEFFETVYPSNGQLDRSLLTQLESEGLLSIEPVRGEDNVVREFVRFSFERFSDHIVAKSLLDSHLDPDNVEGSLKPEGVLGTFITGDEAYRRAGIIEALAVQLPERVGVEILDIERTGSYSRYVIEDAFVESLLLRDQKFFTGRTLELLESIRDSGTVNNVLLSVSTEPENKFNADFLHKCLVDRTMPDRDKVWSAHLTTYGNDSHGEIHTLIGWALGNGFESIEPERARLTATALTWFFTASHRAVRDKATKALASLLAKRLDIAVTTIGRFKDVNDPYVFERLLAAIYGAVLQGVADAGLTEVAQAVHDAVFAGDVPLNALTRDHAAGILLYCGWRKTLPAGIDITALNGPFKSPWPIELVTNEEMETFKQDYGKGQRYGDAIVSSAVSDGDFARYVIDHRVGHWSTAPIGSKKYPLYLDVYQQWLLDFVGWATDEQIALFNALSDTADTAKGENSYKKTAETSARDEAEEAFKASLTPEQREDYKIRARHFALHVLADPSRYHPHDSTFSTRWARRWVCKRAHNLGWTAELFADQERNHSYDRNDHRIERIGKKYQWLALHELIARMSDNLAYHGERWSRDDKSMKFYNGAREIGLRDIDPSLLMTKTYHDGWRDWPKCWWVPFEPQLPSVGPAERLAWLDTEKDVVNDPALIEVTDPRTKRTWLVLHSFNSWSQRDFEDGEKELQRDTWFRLNCVVVRKRDRPKLLKQLTGQMLTDPHSLPRCEMHGDHYIGEFPWHPSLKLYGDWARDDYGVCKGISTRATVSDYLCEKGTYDYSIESTVSIALPTPWLAEAMGGRLTNGRHVEIVDATDKAIFYDPSVGRPGPQAALVDRDVFLAMLERENLAAVWVIAGEKSVYGGRDPSRGFGGRLLHTGIYHYRNGKLVAQHHHEREDPSIEQLKALFAGASVPAGAVTRNLTARGIERRVVTPRNMVTGAVPPKR